MQQAGGSTAAMPGVFTAGVPFPVAMAIHMAPCCPYVGDGMSCSLQACGSYAGDAVNYNSQSSTMAPPGCWVEQEKQKQKNSKTHACGKTAVVHQVPPNELTTICFRNVPNSYSNKHVMDLLDANGFKGMYDFIYVPHDFKRLPVLANVGYFFANFLTHDFAQLAWNKFDGYKDWEPESPKVLAPSWATRTQGLKALIESYQENPVMHPDVPLECKPLVIENGKATQLTSADRQVKRPRLKTTTPCADLDYAGHGTTNACVNIEHRHLTSKVFESACQDTTGIKDTTLGGYASTADTGSYASSDGGEVTADSNSDGDSDSGGEVTSLMSSVVWMPDEAAHGCFKCCASFTFLRRRHHCRGCGRIFCAECAPRTCNQYKRLCVDCGDERLRELESAAVGDEPGLAKSSVRAAAKGLSDKPLVVQNTFITFPRSDTVEELFKGTVDTCPF